MTTPEPEMRLVPVEPTDSWVERYCELTNRHPDGIQGRSTHDGWHETTFRQVARGEITAMLAAAPASMVEVLKPDEGGCVTKRFVVYNRPGEVPEKKGGWLKHEHLIDFLRAVMLHDGWPAGFQATVLELTWDNDLWASTASEYLEEHDYAIGKRAAREAWLASRAKHERIYKAAPKVRLGSEIDSFRKLTAPH